MEFASNCVYDYGGYSSEENIDEADEPSSYTDIKAAVPAPPPPPTCAKGSVLPRPKARLASPSKAATKNTSIPTSGVKKLKKVRKSDTNIISVKFDCLEEQTFTTTSEPIRCEKCCAVMTVLETTLNNLDSEKSSEMKWVCVFCGHNNSVSAEQLANPRNADMLFVPEDENSPTGQETTKPKEEIKEGEKEEEKKVDENDDSVLLFTIDISGSMGCTVAVSAPPTIANSSDDSDDDDDASNTAPAPRPKSGSLLTSLGRMVGFNNTGGPQPQQNRRPASQRPGRNQPSGLNFGGGGLQRSDYISRLDATKSALVQQINDLKTNKPKVKLGVVTFCTDVDYLADGTGSKQKKLDQRFVNDKQNIQKEGMKCEVPGPVSASANILKRAIMQMQPTSMTALGPALLYSVAIAGKQTGSKVIMCTDGMANVGIGSLDHNDRDDDFYTYAAEYANELGVSVSVLAIEGTEVGLASLGQVADLTNGAVNIVKSTSLGTEYAGIVSQRIVGSHVEVTLILHCSLYIRDQLNPADKSNSSKTLKIGNVSADTENFFEFGFKPKEKRKVSVDINNPEEETEIDNEVDSANQEQAGTSSQSNDSNQPSDQEEPGSSSSVAIKVEPEGEKKEEKKQEKKQEKKEEKKEEKSEEMKELPFQIQITYTNRHKVKMTRVITKKMPCSNKREDAEKDVNVALLGAHSVQNAAAISKEREYTKARCALKSKKMFNMRMIERTGLLSGALEPEQLSALNQANACLDSYEDDLLCQQAQEYAMDLNLSDEDCDGGPPGSAPEKAAKKKAVRMKMQSDRSANVMFKNAKVSSKSFGTKK